MPFEFVQHPASERLSRWVASVWFARGQIRYTREYIAPTGATVAVLNLGDAIVHSTQGSRAERLRATTGWLSGPHDRPSLNEPTGRTYCYGVVSTPVGCQRLFGLGARELRGRVVPLERWTNGPSIRRAVADLEPRTGLPVLLERLEAGGSAAPPRLDRVERAVAWLEAEPGASVGELARRLDVSHAYLDREFGRVVGIGPRRLAAILRVRRLLDDLDVFADTDWTAQAAKHGWYDQSHLIRDFKRYTGATPGAYLAAQRAHFERGEAEDAGGFVPLGPVRQVKSVQDARARDRAR